MKLTLLVLLFTSVTICACVRGPDNEILQNDVQARLETEFRPGIFVIAEFKRMGSAPVSKDTCPNDCLRVYFNAQLEFLKDYDLTSWQDLNIHTLAHVLGATENGLQGFNVDGNSAGEMLDVFGTSTYRKTRDGWAPIALSTADKVSVPNYDESLPSSESKRLLGQLEHTIEQRLRADGTSRDEIIHTELALAQRNIGLQLDKLDGTLTVVSGEPGAGYYQSAQEAAEYLTAHGLQLKNYPSAGSVENCRLVHHGIADLAIVQSNVAAMAYAGNEVFSGTRMDELRALASLYPEPVHVVTPAISGLHSIDDLRDKHVGIGLSDSGSRIDAVKVLAAHGIGLADLAGYSEVTVSDAVKLMKAGKIHAFITTHEMPSKGIQDLADGMSLRLLPIRATPKANLIRENPEYIELTIPARTYPGQDVPVDTVAVTALLVARRTMTDERVEEFLHTLMEGIDVIAEQDLRASFLSRQTAHIGVSIPRHPAAERYFLTATRKAL
ncbi:MAG: TAXI family TRAP transporter solute-binding subunit [Woeseiaceae bacterium]|nr:TAXI family TRAP transporter solute-binding subunit [Woeseiaceae bacterium]